MSFLDRFKPTPRWRHTDPAIRAAAVGEIPDDPEHIDTLMELAASDDDVRVRRAAAARIVRVEELVRLARTEPDAELKRELGDRLVEIAITPAGTDGPAARALDGIDDVKQFSTIAKSSPHDTVRTAALGRVHDQKALSSIARHGIDPQTAVEAVLRMSDPAELLNVAMKTDHKEAGLSALERTVDALSDGYVRETLDTITNRAKNKSVSKRARTMLQAIDDAAAARKIAHEQFHLRLAMLTARVEAIGSVPEASDAERQLADARAEWQDAVADPAFEADADELARFTAGSTAAETAIAGRRREEAERREAAARAEALRTSRVALCERVEQARAEEATDQVQTARAEWESLPPADAPDPEGEALRARFERACERALERHANQVELAGLNARLGDLSIEADRLSREEQPGDAWTAVQKEWESVRGRTDAPEPDVLARYADAETRMRLRTEERRHAAERALRQQVQRFEQLIDRALRRSAADDLTLREADRLSRELRAAAETPLEVPDREHHVMVERLKAAHAAVSPRLHELREMDEWKRFANAAVQEELIAKTEALRAKYSLDAEVVATESLEKAAHELHDIQERWKQAAEAPRAQAQALWHRYRQAADPVQEKVRTFFAQRAEERQENLAKKIALIERAEALADSTDWIKTADELKKLQAEWQAVGSVPRQETRATWKRFREACDRFFTRRNTDLAQRKEVWSSNLAKKEALCARAEEIAASKDWDKGAAEIRRLQADWKAIGPVRRNKSEALWQRFRGACDTFFDRYKRRDEIELEGRQADREALVAELEALAPVEAGSAEAAPAVADNAALLESVRSLRSRWNQSSAAVRHGADPLSARFMSALERLTVVHPEAFRGTELDVEANRQKMEKLCVRVEGFLTDAAAQPASSSQALAAMLREALAANTIGGRAGEESKWRAMAEDVRQAQASWNRLGPVPGEGGRQLADRFHRACSRFFDQFRRHVPQQAQPQRGRAVGAR
jgi:hypothetical protein